MYVCICNAVTDKDILNAADAGATTLKHLRDELNIATCCGRCATCAKRLLKEACGVSCPVDADTMMANAVA